MRWGFTSRRRLRQVATQKTRQCMNLITSICVHLLFMMETNILPDTVWNAINMIWRSCTLFPHHACFFLLCFSGQVIANVADYITSLWSGLNWVSSADSGLASLNGSLAITHLRSTRTGYICQNIWKWLRYSHDTIKD